MKQQGRLPCRFYRHHTGCRHHVVASLRAPLGRVTKAGIKTSGLSAHVTQEASAGAGQHGQWEQVEVEGVRLVLALLPHQAGQPKLRDEEALRTIPVLQTWTMASFVAALVTWPYLRSLWRPRQPSKAYFGAMNGCMAISVLKTHVCL